MEISDKRVGELMAAGRAAVRFNAPLGGDRARQLVESIVAHGATSVVDLGCGHGELASLVAAAAPAIGVVGIDRDADQIAAAQASSQASFDVGDIAAWQTPADTIVCVGATHAFGGTVDAISTLAPRARRQLIVADAAWMGEPDDWCRATFGELPTVDDVADTAAQIGFASLDLSTSALDEWDEFEQGFIAGIRSVGGDDAQYFADLRSEEYARYRGVLGFAWLIGTR